MWHNYVIWYVYLTFHQFLKYAMIFLLQQLVRMAQLTLLAMHSILQTSVKVMKWKYMASLCPYGSGYNAWPTRCNISRTRSTWCLAQFFPHAWQTFVEFISPQQFNWFWWFTLHLIARSLQGCNIESTSPQGWSWSQSMIPKAASPMLRFSDHCVGARGESIQILWNYLSL